MPFKLESTCSYWFSGLADGWIRIMFGHSDPGNNTEVSMPKALQVKCLFVYVLEKVQGGLVSTKKSHLEKLQS